MYHPDGRYFIQHRFTICIQSTNDYLLVNLILEIKQYNKTITFNFPFEKSEFSAPEILNIYSLPTTICDRASYYSLGILTIYCLLSLIPRNEIEIKEALIPINQTKIYWFLLKVLDKDSSKRVILFI